MTADTERDISIHLHLVGCRPDDPHPLTSVTGQVVDRWLRVGICRGHYAPHLPKPRLAVSTASARLRTTAEVLESVRTHLDHEVVASRGDELGRLLVDEPDVAELPQLRVHLVTHVGVPPLPHTVICPACVRPRNAGGRRPADLKQV